MAKGQKIKKEIADKILSTFEGSFLYNGGKEIRICGIEDGEQVQVKVTLTAAKVNVEQGDENKLPAAAAHPIENNGIVSMQQDSKDKDKNKDTIVTPTQEEKDNIKKLLSSLGL